MSSPVFKNIVSQLNKAYAHFAREFIKAVASVLYLGYLPLIPGTFGSAAGLGLYWIVKESALAHLAFVLGAAVLGFWSSGEAAQIMQRKDSPQIIIDEVCGMLIALLFLPVDLKLALLAFFLFRLTDTLKPYPASVLQRIEGSAGIMLDDIVAGIYTNLILQAAIRLVSLIAS